MLASTPSVTDERTPLVGREGVRAIAEESSRAICCRLPYKGDGTSQSRTAGSGTQSWLAYLVEGGAGSLGVGHSRAVGLGAFLAVD